MFRLERPVHNAPGPSAPVFFGFIFLARRHPTPDFQACLSWGRPGAPSPQTNPPHPHREQPPPRPGPYKSLAEVWRGPKRAAGPGRARACRSQQHACGTCAAGTHQASSKTLSSPRARPLASQVRHLQQELPKSLRAPKLVDPSTDPERRCPATARGTSARREMCVCEGGLSRCLPHLAG